MNFHRIPAAALLICLLLPFASCGKAPDPGTGSSSGLPEEPPLLPEEEPLEEPPNPAELRLTVNGRAETLSSAPDGVTYRFLLPESERYNVLEILPTGQEAKVPEGDLAVTIRRNGEILYQPGDSPDSRVCRFPEQPGGEYTVKLQSAGEIQTEAELLRFGRIRPGTAAAYFPASGTVDVLDSYRENLSLLSRLTVITGLCWDGAGEVQVIDGNFPSLMAKLTEVKQETGLQVYATIYPQSALIRSGAAGTTVDTPEKRGRLIENLLELCEAYSLDGIDLDWETPVDDAEWAACSALVQELSGALREKGWSLSAALYPESAGKLSGEAIRSLDTLNLMAYDQFDGSGRHSTFRAASESVRKALEAGYRPEQILLGIPAYGRPLDASAKWPLYLEPGLGERQNLSGDAYFNSVGMVRDKAAFAALCGLKGTFLYPLTGDLPASDPLSLTRACTE